MLSKPRLPNGCIAFRRAGTALTVAAGLVACPLFAPEAAAFKLFGLTLFGDDETSVEVIDPVDYAVTFDTDGADKDLAKSLEATSLLVGDTGKAVSGDLGLVIKARDDRDRLIATLYENARYGGVVTVLVNGTPIDDLPPNPTFSHDAPVPVSIRVEPGPQFVLGKVNLEGDAARLDPAAYGLVPGGDAGSLVVLKGAARIVEDLKAEGRPLARLTARDVVADHQNRTIEVTIAAEAGPVAPIGAVGVSGAKAVDPEFVRRYSRLNEGEPYTPEKLTKAAERLRKLGVFSSVTLKEAEALSTNGSLPVEIALSEGKHRYFGIGATVSSIDGLGLEGYWGHRNLFGQAESLRIEGAVGRLGDTTEIGNLDYSAGVSFTKPGAFFPAATLSASVKAATKETASYDVASVTAKTALAYELTDVDTISGGAELQWSDINDAFGSNRYLTASVPIEYIRDTRDSTLDPTEGYRAALAATPSYEILGQTFFSSFEGTVSAYRSLGEDDRVIFAGKLGLGTMFGGGSLSDIPADRRFYAGGGGSVRGYAYEEISPYNGAGDPTGGRSYALGSFEARINITDTIGIVPFVDAASVSASNFPDFSDIRVGAGVGLRYATPFGPIRLDIAAPLNRYDGGSRYGIYAGIGQSF